MSEDLTDARRGLLTRRESAVHRMERSIAAAKRPASAHAFLATNFMRARESAAAADNAIARGADPGPLVGLAISVKDLFDVAGEVTTAGSTVLAGAGAALADAPAVARLRGCGAALIGRTNMSEFAFSGVGINPHHGTPVNPATAAIGTSPRIPGGSTSGGAVSVASGAAWAALGSDTGGSIRIPAALQGLVGFKSTARLVPTEGAIPLSTTLDTAAAITLSVRDAALLHGILSAQPPVVAARPLRECRFAVPETLMLDGLEAGVARAFAGALAALSAAGARVDTIKLPLLGEVASINASGGFSAAESWAWHRSRLLEHEAAYDPRVVVRIRRGATMTAADYIDLLAARRDWIALMDAMLAPYDALLSPTLPITAPELAPLVEDDTAFFAVNALLLRNPSVVNLLDGCALSLPCHEAGEMPVGLMIWHSALHDAAVLAAGLAAEAALGPVRAHRVRS